MEFKDYLENCKNFSLLVSGVFHHRILRFRVIRHIIITTR